MAVCRIFPNSKAWPQSRPARGAWRGRNVVPQPCGLRFCDPRLPHLSHLPRTIRAQGKVEASLVDVNDLAFMKVLLDNRLGMGQETFRFSSLHNYNSSDVYLLKTIVMGMIDRHR